jgi:hypothetical protein
MNDSIDIVITYLNSNDEKWIEDFNYWKNKEIKEHKAKLSNRQAFGVERTREWNTLRYWFRGIENNCKWVNKVFLIVQNERHIPKWINRENKKLRIVYHEEFIPKELLPTFNAMTIGMYISRIKDLSNNYILCDDDYYFINEIKEDRFFKNNIPVHQNNRLPFGLYKCINGTDGVFFHILNNDLRFETKYMSERIKYGINHLPEARNKRFENMILNDNEEEIKKSLGYSKFRHKKNLCSYVFSDLLKLCNEVIFDKVYKNCSYIALKSDINFDEYKDKDIVCFNDTEQLDDYEKTKKKFLKFLNDKFPNKCSYEKGDDEDAF